MSIRIGDCAVSMYSKYGDPMEDKSFEVPEVKLFVERAETRTKMQRKCQWERQGQTIAIFVSIHISIKA